ncbi:MAG: Lrp/AsnC family transcriptional regulator [Alphaproteobacteria bacterium]|nr:MAG: Lrp/AsnC family transcriptional regulator [Alphaproteobacteria bacterium]
MTRVNDLPQLESIEIKILNLIQKDFSISPRPFLDMAEKLGISEDVVLKVVKDLLERGILTRVGPFYNMDKSSGYVSLVAMVVPENRYIEVTDIVNSYEEVAHNYKREHQFNMWFVIASTSKEEVLELLAEIEKRTEIKTFNFPKLKEFALDLYFEVS